MFSGSSTADTKFVKERINQAEKYLGSICVQYGKICRKQARLRDSHDGLVQNMLGFADQEKINTSLRQGLKQHAGYLSAAEDYRQAMITRIETQILTSLAKYGELVKQKRKAVQKAIDARDKLEQGKRKFQQTAARNPSNQNGLATMQAQNEQAETEVLRADKIVQEEIDQFEQTKLRDLKKYLTDFTLFNLAYHARALEMYTLAHQELLKIDVEHDLEEFRNTAPFHRLHLSQRSASETALNVPRRGVNNLAGAYSGSMNALSDRRHDTKYGSHSSLPVDSGSARRGHSDRSDERSAQHRYGAQSGASPTAGRSKKQGASAAALDRNATKRSTASETTSSSSDDSDD